MKLTTEIFIKRSEEIHDFFYLYDKSIYINYKTKLIINCPIHGDFLQTPECHLSKRGCSICGESKKDDLESFISKSNKKHNFRYDYSLVKFKNRNEIVDIVCEEHGIFKQSVMLHIRGSGCQICNLSKGELEVMKFLNDNCIIYETQKRFYDLKNLSFDFYIPNLNICIEYNGIQHYEILEYFGGAGRFKKQQINDQIKVDYCLDKNIELVIVHHKESNISCLLSSLINNLDICIDIPQCKFL